MQFSHPVYATDTAFDEQHLLPDAGLIPLPALADRAGLGRLLTDRVSVAGGKGAGHDAAAKVTSVTAGMAAGADSIDDLDVLRHGSTATVFDKVKAPSTLGSHLRAYTFGHIRQLDAVAWRLLIGLHRCTGLLNALAAKGAITYVDVDAPPPFGREVPPPSRRCTATPSRHLQGVAFGYSHVKGLNAQIATISTPAAGGTAPVIAAARLRKGNVASAHGAKKIVGEAVAVARAAGAHTVVVRADSARTPRTTGWTWPALQPRPVRGSR